jgi:NAD(P)H-dependent FMN reductase
MLLIDASVKDDSNTSRVVAKVAETCQAHRRNYTVAELTAFPSFTGNYITGATGLPPAAATFIQTLQVHQDHLYFVPTYYKSLPGVFKNYLDIVQLKSLYHQKRIGIVATNAKNQDYGARQFLQVLLGLLEFHRAVAVVVPQILVLDPEDPDMERFDDYLRYFLSFPKP